MKNPTIKSLKESLRVMGEAFPIRAVVHKAEDGGFWVESLQLGGCFAAGDTVREALHNFKFAIFEYFDIPQKFQTPKAFEIHSLEFPEPQTTQKPEVVRFVQTQDLIVA